MSSHFSAHINFSQLLTYRDTPFDIRNTAEAMMTIDFLLDSAFSGIG
ncbi:hypothetical protein [Lacimicrobium sp. SS2-24]|nr:hypothetical protein [Lacimicrobium sp. SS2-24]